jgi:hypothetical protein
MAFTNTFRIVRFVEGMQAQWKAKDVSIAAAEAVELSKMGVVELLALRNACLELHETVDVELMHKQTIETYTRIELPDSDGLPLYQKFIGGQFDSYVREVPDGYCGYCGGRKLVGESCGCFDNDGQ